VGHSLLVSTKKDHIRHFGRDDGGCVVVEGRGFGKPRFKDSWGESNLGFTNSCQVHESPDDPPVLLPPGAYPRKGGWLHKYTTLPEVPDRPELGTCSMTCTVDPGHSWVFPSLFLNPRVTWETSHP
jgi:hypothetical protein